MRMSESIKELSSALSKFQGEVRNPNNEATNPQFRSKYAPLDVVINTVKPILSKYGLSFIQSTSSEGELIGITTLILHESGEWIESDTLYVPAYQLKKGGEKEWNAQGQGSAQTYGRRYQLSAMLGISSEDDDDANGQVFGGNGGYKDASNNKPPMNQTKNVDAEKKRQEAIEKAQAKSKAQNQAESEGERKSAEELATTGNVEMITTGQERAIDNLLKLTSRKKHSFDKEAFLTETLAGFGVGTLQELTSDQAKEFIAKCNAEMKA